ncbi:MAG: ankyrin repeat domain-containing protein [Oligoflexia bacterium]|nr:ankyrin repeat domain-containing protein [Oligoflexia bacterium]
MEEAKRLLSVESCSSEEFKGNNLAYLARTGVCSDVNLTISVSRKTALFYVKSVKMAEYLISKGADINIKADYQETPLHTASNVPVAEFFLEKGLDIEAKEKDDDEEDGYTPLYYAVFDERYDVAEFLFKKGANPHAGEDTPLSEAESKSRWYTFRLNRLIKAFEDYTPSETDQSNTAGEDSQNTKP